jgi:hypothetical protein
VHHMYNSLRTRDQGAMKELKLGNISHLLAHYFDHRIELIK